MKAVRELRDTEVLHALAAASRHSDPYLANVLATEALNRYRRLAATFAAVAAGAAAVVLLRLLVLVFTFVSEERLPEIWQLTATAAILVTGALIALIAYMRARAGTLERSGI